MNKKFNTKYPSIAYLRIKAKSKMPKFAFEYLDGGCNDDHNLRKNTADLREIELVPQYLKSTVNVSLKTSLFDTEYDAPFGIAPIGLKLMQKAPEILAKAAFLNNILYFKYNYSNIEKIGEITEGKGRFSCIIPQKRGKNRHYQ